MFIQDLIERKVKRERALTAKKTAKDVAIGLGIGVTLGAAAGILFAPKSGKETREDIATGTKDVIEKVKDQVEEVGKFLKKELDDDTISEDVKAVSRKIKDKAEDVKTKVKKEVAEKEDEAKKE